MLTLGGLYDGVKIFIKIIPKLCGHSTEIQGDFITKTNRLMLFTEIHVFAIYVKLTNTF
jgi:hypothetical protein